MLKIRVIRQCQGLSQLRLALAVDMCQSRYCSIERGDIPPTEDERRRLAEFLGAPTATLFRSVLVQRKATGRGERAVVSV